MYRSYKVDKISMPLGSPFTQDKQYLNNSVNPTRPFVLTQVTDISSRRSEYPPLSSKMKFFIAALALAATAIAGDHDGGHEGAICDNGSTVVCKDNGNGGMFTLGNIAPGALGQSCTGGDVYCCKEEDIEDVRSISTTSLEIANYLPRFLGWPHKPQHKRSVQSQPLPLNGLDS